MIARQYHSVIHAGHENETRTPVDRDLYEADLSRIVFADVELLVVALGGSIHEGAGSRIAFELNGTRRYLHRPHPGKEAKRYQLEDLREWFIEMRIKP